MIRVTLRDTRSLFPFNDLARDLRIQNKPLWLHHRDVLAPYVQGELQIDELNDFFSPGFTLNGGSRDCLIYRDNLFFDQHYIHEFIGRARNRNHPSRAAFNKGDRAFVEHALPLSSSYTLEGENYLADLWYYPNGPVNQDPEPLVIDLEPREVGYYHVPMYLATSQGDLTFQVPLKAFIAIDSWVHIFIADVVYGLFARGARFENQLDQSLWFKLGILASAILERKRLIDCSRLVKIGTGCVIDPSATIHGPTTIGNHVTIGAGAVVENCIIGDNVNISQGCQLMLSVVGDGAFLPFRAGLFMTTLMENSMVAQNTCLQMSVIGRNSFIGAGNTFTDYNLLPTAIHALDGKGKLSPANRDVLGGCVGHNCRIGSGVIVYPARAIESDVVLVATGGLRVISRDVYYKDSDHHHLEGGSLHKRQYAPGQVPQEAW